MLPVILAKVTAVASISSHTTSNGQPCVGCIDVSLVVDDFVDLSVNMSLVFSREASYDNVVISVVARHLAIPVVGLAAVTSTTLGVARNLSHITHQKYMGEVAIGIVLVLDIGLDGRVGGARSAGANHCSRSTNLFLPIDERLHGGHEGIVADDEQLASLDHRCVLAQAFAVVDETTLIHLLDFGVHLHHGGVAVKDVFDRYAVAVHFNGHVVVHA